MYVCNHRSHPYLGFAAADYFFLIMASGIVSNSGNFTVTHTCDFSMLTDPTEGLEPVLAADGAALVK